MTITTRPFRLEPSLDVLSVGHGFEMQRVYARRVPTEMIENRSIWNVATGELKGDAVSLSNSGPAGTPVVHATVAVQVNAR